MLEMLGSKAELAEKTARRSKCSTIAENAGERRRPGTGVENDGQSMEIGPRTTRLITLREDTARRMTGQRIGQSGSFVPGLRRDRAAPPAASIRDPEASPSESEVTVDVAARGYRQA
jgi:hypothetical protein